MSERAIESIFLEYLHSYHKWLKSIADILVREYLIGSFGESRERRYVNGLFSRVILEDNYISELKAHNKGNKIRAKRNLLNSWYNECTLRYPEKNIMDYESMKFASWKIIQFYYTIFTGLSSLNRDFYRGFWRNHNTAIDIFVENLLVIPSLNNKFFIPPFCFVLKDDKVEPSFEKAISWPYGLSYHCPNLNECLIDTKNKRKKKDKIISLFHFFKCLREWATYQSAYIFINLYGQGPKAELEMCLKDISFCFNYLVEKFQIKFYGFREINVLYQDFLRRMERHLKIKPFHLITRFDNHILNE